MEAASTKKEWSWVVVCVSRVTHLICGAHSTPKTVWRAHA